MAIHQTFPFSLRLKTTVILLTIFFFMGLIGFMISRGVLLHAALKTETQLVNTNIQRVRNVLNEEVVRLETLSMDWGHWDDTYRFSKDKNDDYIEKNLDDDIFTSNKWSYFLLFTPKDTLFYAKGYDLQEQKVREISRSQLKAYFYPGSYFFTYVSPLKPQGGLALLDGHVQFIASTQILTSNKLGPMSGILVLSRELTKEQLASFSKNVELPLVIHSLTSDSPEAHISAELTADKQQIITHSKGITIQLLLDDVNNKPIAVITFHMPRTIYRNMEASIRFFLGLLALTGLISLLTLGLWINWTILKRIRLFNAQITQIARNTDYTRRVDIASRDELNSMAIQVNILLDVIQTSQKKLNDRMQTINTANEKLKTLEEEKHKIIKYTPDPIIITNATGIVQLINNAVKKTFGCRSTEMKNQSIDTLFSLELIDKTSVPPGALLSTHENPESGKEYLITYREKSIPVVLKTALIGTQSKIYIFHDISERKRHEKELMLLNQKLIMASREAGMSDVSRMLLHNIGNILNSVLVSLSLMQEDIKKSRLNHLEALSTLFQQHKEDPGRFLMEDEKGKKIPTYLILLGDHWKSDRENLLSQLESMNVSVNRIIMVIKNFQVHHTSTLVEEIDMVELLDNVVNIHRTRFKKGNIEIIKHYTAVPLIHQDRFKIWHILNNLITNAIDAVNAAELPAAYVELWIETYQGGIRVQVKDNGIGIAEDNLVTIFLFRHTSKAEGSGIGLHSSAILAKEIGASLDVYSEGPGKGATFVLDIPGEMPKEIVPIQHTDPL